MTLLGIRSPLDDATASHVPVDPLARVRGPLTGHDPRHHRRERVPVKVSDVELGAGWSDADSLEPREARERIGAVPGFAAAE